MTFVRPLNRRTVPIWPYRIDAQHTLFDGLITAFSSQNSIADFHRYLLDRKIRHAVAPASGMGPGQDAIGWLCAATADFITFDSVPFAPDVCVEISSGSDFTFECIIDNIGRLGTNPGFWRNGNIGSGTSFLIQNGSTRRPWMNMAASEALKPTSGPQWTEGQRLHLFVRQVSGTSTDAWWDGRQQHTNSHAIATADMAVGNGLYNFSMQANNNEITTGSWQRIRFWDRALTDAELDEASNDPKAGYEEYHRRAFFMPTAAATISAAITGTAQPSITEAEVTAGGETIIITLTNDTFVAAGTGPIGSTADTQALIDGISAATSPALHWNAEWRDKEVTTAVARTSATVATVTMSSQATISGSFDNSAQETVTVTVPAAVLTTSASPVVATPTFTVEPTAATSGIQPSSLSLLGTGA